MELFKLQILGPHIRFANYEYVKIDLKSFWFCFNVDIRITTKVTVFANNVLVKNAAFVDRPARV